MQIGGLLVCVGTVAFFSAKFMEDKDKGKDTYRKKKE